MIRGEGHSLHCLLSEHFVCTRSRAGVGLGARPGGRGPERLSLPSDLGKATSLDHRRPRTPDL